MSGRSGVRGINWTPAASASGGGYCVHSSNERAQVTVPPTSTSLFFLLSGSPDTGTPDPGCPGSSPFPSLPPANPLPPVRCHFWACRDERPRAVAAVRASSRSSGRGAEGGGGEREGDREDSCGSVLVRGTCPVWREMVSPRTPRSRRSPSAGMVVKRRRKRQGRRIGRRRPRNAIGEASGRRRSRRQK